MSSSLIIGVSAFSAALGTALGFLLGRYVWCQRPAVEPSAFAALQTELARLDQECSTWRTRAAEFEASGNLAMAEARRYGEECARFSERVGRQAAELSQQINLAREIEARRDAAAEEAKALAAEVARLKEREGALNDRLNVQAAQFADLQKQLTAEFENIANRILKASATELSESSRKGLAATLDPFRERMLEFQKKVETTYAAETREVLSLKEHVRLVMETTHAIGTQADGLAKALRGDLQLLGRWGELALERILETAGLQEGREYITQGRGLKLRSEEGGLQRPDVIVVLPEDHTMIIDSKAPLASYERLIATRDETERAVLGQHFVRDMKGHIDSLAGKRYQENSALRAHDCVLMFVPIEGALAAALTSEPNLFTYAWERHVVLVGPPTLLMTLRTVASIWRYQQQGENAQEIARLAGELCDKISNSIGDLNSVADKMHTALGAHSEAMKRLFTGRGNALGIGDRIKALGVKAKRPPNVVVDGSPLMFASSATEESEDDAEPTPQAAASTPV